MANQNLPELPPHEENSLEIPFAQALLGEVPGAGAVVTYALESIRQEREERLRGFLADVSLAIRALHERTSEIENRLDPELLNTAEFRRVLAVVAEEALRTPDEVKLRYLRDFVVNNVRVHHPDVFLRDEFWTLVRSLSGTQCLVLANLHSLQGWRAGPALVDLARNPDHPDVPTHNAIAANLKVHPDLLAHLLAGLTSRGLVRILPGSTTGADHSDRLVLTNLGRIFFSFVAGTWQG